MVAVELREGVPERGALWDLFLTTGWNDDYHLAPGDLHRAFVESWLVVGAYENQQLVGIGRLVSDRVVHAMVYDLIVAPGSQRRGIGGLVLDRLVSHCRAHRIRDVQLFSAKGKRGFYEKRGFVARPDDGPGMERKEGS